MGDALLCELDAQSRVTSTSTWGANGLVAKARTTYSSTGAASTMGLLYAFDERGNTVNVVNQYGGLEDNSAFDAVGGRVWGRSDSTGFGGQWGYYTDSETGLILCTLRYYDPAAQRWVTRDPIGFSGGINLYGYVGNNPMKRVDPSGLYVETLWDAANLAVGSASFVHDLREGNYGWATVDAMGVVYDAFAAGIPILPGGAGFGIRSLRGVGAVAGVARVTSGAGLVIGAGRVMAASRRGGDYPEDDDDEPTCPMPRRSSDPQRKPGRRGQFKGTDALRRENRTVADVVGQLGLDKDQQRRLHDALQGGDRNFQEILEFAKQMFDK